MTTRAGPATYGRPVEVWTQVGAALSPEAGAGAWTYAALLPAMVLEGPVATVVGGALAGAGHASLLAVWVLAVGADLVADSLLFAVGRAGHRPRAARWLHRLGLRGERRERLSRRAHEHLGSLVVGAKLVDVGAVPAFLATGLAGVPFHRVLGWNAVCTAVRAGALVALGVLAGRHAQAVLEHWWAAPLAGLALGGGVLAVRALVLRARSAAGRRRGVARAAA